MARKRARASRVAAVVALAAAALLARERLGARGAASPGSGEVGARGSTSASAGLASRVPTPEASDAFDADGAVVSSPTTDDAVERAGGTARVPSVASVSSSALSKRGEARAAEGHGVMDDAPASSDGETKNAAKLSRVVDVNDKKSASLRYGFDENFVTATFATIEVVDMLRNWVAHAVFVANLPNVAIVALDSATLELCANGLSQSRITCLDASRGFFLDADALKADERSNNGPLIGHRENKAVFNQIGIVKTKVLSALLHASLTVLMSDVDVVWLRNPAEYFNSGQLRRAHLAVSSDCVFGFEPNRPMTDLFGQKPSPNNAEFNTGVLFLRPTIETRNFVQRWTASQLESKHDHSMNDQSHFNRVVNAFGGRVEIQNGGAFAWDDDADKALAKIVGSYEGDRSASTKTSHDTNSVPDSELFPEEHEKGLRPRYYLTAADPNENNRVGDGPTTTTATRVALLPTGLFSNGHTFFVSRLAERSGVTPFAVHNTYQYSGTAGKIARFRENGLWAVDDAAYYGYGDSEDADRRKFLVINYDIPSKFTDSKRALATPKGETPHDHISLMTYQVNRIRDGLAIASLLNRTLVMPPLLSTCDRWFNLLPNCTQGDAKFPMLAPIDHAFLVFALDAFNGGGKYVEHDFFANRARFIRSRSKDTKKRTIDDVNDKSSDAKEVTHENAFGLGPVARLEFETPPEGKEKDNRERGAHDGAFDGGAFRVPEDFASVPGYEAFDPSTTRAIQTVKRGAPKHFVVNFGSVASDLIATLGEGNDARVLVAERLSPGAFAGFGSLEENAAFHTKMLTLMHEWCCRFNGTVPHLPTPYGEEEHYGASVR